MTEPSCLHAYRQQLYDCHHCRGKKVVALVGKEYHRWARGMQTQLRGWLPENKHTPILDLGCGAGNLLLLFSRLGFTDLTGVDVSPGQVARARLACPQAEVIHGDLRGFLKETTKEFGIITAFDVIEHFDKNEILPLLEQIKTGLAPGGRVIFQTPNAASPWVGPVAYGDFTHEWFFTPESLGRLLELVGFRDYAVRSCPPHSHGLKSFIRAVLWQGLRAWYLFGNLVETGGVSNQGIYTRVFLATALAD